MNRFLSNAVSDILYGVLHNFDCVSRTRPAQAVEKGVAGLCCLKSEALSGESDIVGRPGNRNLNETSAPDKQHHVFPGHCAAGVRDICNTP